MKPVFYSVPMVLPHPDRNMNREIRLGVEQFSRRALELWRAAALIAAAEPGQLTAADRDTARRRGLAAGKRILAECPKGKARIAYLRTLTEDGLHANPETVTAMAEQIWLLENRYGLADSYLRAVADAAIQHGAECILCPSPLEQGKLEAVFLPDSKAAFLSANTAENVIDMPARRVHLDRIPDSERKIALKNTLKENRAWIEALIQRAAECLRNAEILRTMKSDTCAAENLRL